MKNNISHEALDVLKVSLCQKSFYAFCRIMYPRFYTKERIHLKDICETLQKLIENNLFDEKGNRVNNLLLAMPPRHGKSYTIQNLSKWLLGRFPGKSIITVSYNQSLSIRAGKEVRNAISEKKINGGRLVYSDIFPKTKIKDGDGAQDIWAIEGSHFSYLSTSPTGTLTGTGATGLFVIDDIIKSAYEANNENILSEHFQWYNDTARSRVEVGCKRLVIMTRWSTQDIFGKILQSEPELWHKIILPACKNEETGEMLAPDILSFEEYKDRQKATDPVIMAGNYQQKPFDLIDRLYPNLREYDPAELPASGADEAYIDTADTGSDYLAGATYRVKDGIAYITDILYTQDAMEVTEPKAAAMLDAAETARAWIESNNGGRGFARNVEAKIRAAGNTKTRIEWFHQGQNKEARILAESASVQNCVRFPRGWKTIWPEFYRDVTKATRSGKRKHDDALDMLTGIVEKSIVRKGFVFA